jgi:hypothetical protein
MVGFEFIVQEQDAYKTGFTKETRTRIRKQAMKKIGEERRKHGDYGKHNLRQCPIVVDEIIDRPVPTATTVPLTLPFRDGSQSRDQLVGLASRSESAAGGGSGSGVHSDPDTCIAAPMPLSGVDRMVADYDINPVHFSALTNIQLGGVAASVLSHEPERLQHLLGGQHWSYFSFVPSRFGHYPFLDDAVRCLVAKVRSMVTSSAEAESVVLSHYGKALKSLQEAVQDPNLAMGPDVLGATGILSVFEVSMHFCIRLIQLCVGTR